MAKQPNLLTSRLRQLQAETRKEYEESGREKLNAAKIIAAAAVYAEDQAANHSSGYQSNDSAPEESNEEPSHNGQSDFECAQVGDDLHAMTLEDMNRPWHEEVDEYLDNEHASHLGRTASLCNGHDVSAASSRWVQENARNIPLENRNDIAQPSGAGQASWPQALEDQTHADEWPCQTHEPQAYASNTYRLFDEPSSRPTNVFPETDHSSTQNAHHRQWQTSALPAAQVPQYTFQDRRQFDEQPIDTHEYDRGSAQQWAQPAQRLESRQYEQHQYTDACGQPQPDDTPHWMNTNSDNQTQQFISPRVVSVAAALSTMNLAPRSNATDEYLAQTSPMQSAGYDNTTLQYTTSPAGHQNHLLKLVEPCASSQGSQTYRVANCANTDVCSTFENQVVCVESQEPANKYYYVLVDHPPSLSEVDVSKPPPPLPVILNNNGSVNSISNSANTTEVSYVHQTDARHSMQPSPSTLVRLQMPPHATVDMQRYASQQIAQSSPSLSETLYPHLTPEMLGADATQSDVHGRIAHSSSYPTNVLYSQLSDAPLSDTHQRIGQSSSYSPNMFHSDTTHEMLQADALQSDGHQHLTHLPCYSHSPLYAPKSPQMYADAPQSDSSYWDTPLPSSPPQGATPDTLYSEVVSQQQMTSGSSYIQPSHFDCETSVDKFAMQRCVSPVFETPCPEYDEQPHCKISNEKPLPFNPSFDDFGRQVPTTEPVSHLSPLRATAPMKHSKSASTAYTRRSVCTASPTEVRAATVAISTPDGPESAQTTPTNPSTAVRRDGQRWANSRNDNQSVRNTTTNLPNGMSRDAKEKSRFESAQTTPANQENSQRWNTRRGANSRNSNDSGYSTPQDRRQQQRHSDSNGRFNSGNRGPASGNRSIKRASYTPEEEHRLSVGIMDSYGSPLDTLLERCFSKSVPFGNLCTLRSNRHGNHGEDMFVTPLWPQQACSKLADCKDRLNNVKERLSSYDLNDWHRHTRTTNPADLVMRRLRSDVKVEFLTQAWCKFYELVVSFKLVPQDARKSGELRTIHLCEAPGAFVASLNHYLRLNYPKLNWRWKANSLNPYYEGNHLSAMINDDRFMLQTIENWDFGPDMTGDIMHPGYPDHLRQVWGDGQLTHLVTADGSFDCQDKPEEQEKLVSWLHLKEALTAIRVLRKGGHFVIKMFTFFECESVCLLYLLHCVFESIHVMKPATSKEGNSEVYVVCREFKDEPSFEPFIRRLIDIDEETFSKFAMFPLERIPRPFIRALEECATKFAKFQMDVIERNIRLYRHERYDEFRRHFEFVQEKLFQKYVQRYKLEPIPLEETVVRMPHRRNDNRFSSSTTVLEQRERKQGSHDDQLKRSSLGHKDLVKVVADELAAFPHRQMLSKMSTLPKVELLPQDFDIRYGKPIHTITSSQFCHGMLIRVRNELMNTMDHKKYYIAAAEMERSVDMQNNPEQYPNLCDFAKPLMLMKTYNDTQREIYGMLFDRLTTLEKNGHLTLFCFPLLTQFNISVLCILSQIFEEVVLEPPSTLYLRKRDTRNFGLWMPKLQEISRTYTSEQAVISFLPIRKITGSSNPFYSWVIEANNSQIIREINLFSSYHS